MPVVLTKEQQSFIDKVTKSPAGTVHVLTGEAGSGKTFTTSQLATLMREGCVYASPTHQAATVLRDELKAKEALGSVSTVARLLGTRPNYDEEPGGIRETVFQRSGDGSLFKELPEGGLLVVDEASMVGEMDLRQLIAGGAKRHAYIVVTGDPEQLQPVQMTPCWDYLESLIEAGRATRTHLTQNLRAGNAELASFINHVRKHGALPKKLPKMVKCYDDAPKFAKSLVSQVAAASGDVARMPVALAWRNVTVDELGEEARAQLGYDPEWHDVGEVLRVSQPYQVLNWREEYDALRKTMPQEEAFREATRKVADVRLQTGDLIRVLKRDGQEEYGAPFATSKATVESVSIEVVLGELEGKQFTIKLPRVGAWTDRRSPLSKLMNECYGAAQSLNKWLKDDRKSKLPAPEAALAAFIIERSKGKLPTPEMIPSGQAWSQGFYNVRGQVAAVASACALTVHKAQGSGRRAVFVDVTDLKGGPGELLYVAVSRAREELHLLVA